MIVTVTPNPALDVTGHVDEVVVGESHRLTRVTARAGGKGVNVAAVASALGVPATAVLAVGPESTATFESDLARREVPAVLVASPVPTRRSVAAVDAEGEATVLNEEGEAPPVQTWDALVEALSRACDGAEALVVSGSVAPGSPEGVVTRLLETGAAAGCALVADARGEDLLAALDRARRDGWRLLAKPNLAEARESLHDDTLDASACAAALLDLGAWCAVVSDGARGLVLAVREGGGVATWSARLPEPVRGNPTGAGDALTAALAAHLGQGEPDWERALRAGVAWSAAAVLRPVAGEVDPGDVERLLPQVEVTRL